MVTNTHLLLFLISSSLQVLAALAAAAGYVPSDSILLNSGSSEDAVDADGRRWAGDRNDRYRLSSGNSAPARAAFQDPSLPSQVPYMSARLFTSPSTYKFSVSGKTPHYVRLHFYPASYNGLDPADAYFDVAAAAGAFTLLRNFSAHETAMALTQAYIVREFYLPASPDGVLRLTFTPSAAHKGSYAFVNGIEVVSAPDLYTSPASLVGFSGQDLDVGGSAGLQTMYRLNVGGQYVPATNDSGLSRTWYDDTPYVFGAAVGVTYEAEGNVTVRYPADVPGYVAPLQVYRTARSMGPDPQVNLNSNLTWVFQVDGGFTYVVRFHWCELQLTKVNQRAFDVYLNNRTAQAGADVVAWASAPAVPVYRDYAIVVGDEEELWVALHPSTASKPEYYDALLNGLEIFKVNDTAGNLAGPNPSPSAMLAEADDDDEAPAQFASPGSSGRGKVIGGAAGGAAAVGLVFAICIAVYNRKKRVDGVAAGGNSGGSGWLPLYGGSSSGGGNNNSRSTISGKSSGAASSHLSSLAVSLCRHFSVGEIKQATRNFDESLVIGVGGFGKVYKGVVDGGTTKVAIKRSNPSSEQGVHEFQTEIEMLSKLRHRHLVSLIGYCEEGEEMILVYDYMARGTLREHLYKSNQPPLPWKQRLEICIGAARGLHYLHTGAKYPIIHRDVKTTNILVDDRWVAKVSDFGLSKTGPSSLDQTHVSTVVKGSFGYLDPEYFRRQQLTDKSDVYSFGVVLFEVLCARAALDPSLPREQVSLADWALLCTRRGTLHDILDPALRGHVAPECLHKFASTAEKCLSDHGVDRPAMGDVLWNLEFALQLQDTADQGGGAAAPRPPPDNFVDRRSGGDNGHNPSGSVGGSSEVSDESDGMNASAVFSQLVHPRGR